ncbi:MAG: hypothetical protein JST16_13685 [Bdellovibrionales bacterium]|nr:hypothetical protein [Bdellovibrionales bacterium]
MKTSFAWILALSFAAPAFAEDPAPAPVPAPAPAPQTTVITKNTLQYAQSFPMGNQSAGVVGGKVDFTGPGPVFVTLVNGGQSYTSPVDQFGQYSFFIFVANNNINTTAWVPGQATAAVPSTAAKSQAVLR